MLNLIAADSPQKKCYWLVLVVLLVTVFIGAVRSLINLETVVPLRLDINLEVASFSFFGMLHAIHIRSIIIDLGNIDDSEILDKIIPGKEK